jgi:hypothetical protein
MFWLRAASADIVLHPTGTAVANTPVPVLTAEQGLMVVFPAMTADGCVNRLG